MSEGGTVPALCGARVCAAAAAGLAIECSRRAAPVGLSPFTV
ncbi:hypothetical protein [Streptomyces sp. NPDC002587]